LVHNDSYSSLVSWIPHAKYREFFAPIQPEQLEQHEQSEQPEQHEQSEQPEQYEQYEQSEQCEQSEQYEQCEQSEQYELLSIFTRASFALSALLIASNSSFVMAILSVKRSQPPTLATESRVTR
jgi:hypothetical protein